MTRSYLHVAGLLIAGQIYAAPALASDAAVPAISTQDVMVGPAAEPDAPRASMADAQQAVAASENPFPTAAVADETRLANVTGMADVRALQQNINVRNTSTVSGNIINGDPVTGTISIDGASFGAFNGLAMVNANTGNNVSINSAMNVNVAIQP